MHIFYPFDACPTLESEGQCQLNDCRGRSRECREYNRQSACSQMLKRSTGCQNLTLDQGHRVIDDSAKSYRENIAHDPCPESIM